MLRLLRGGGAGAGGGATGIAEGRGEATAGSVLETNGCATVGVDFRAAAGEPVCGLATPESALFSLDADGAAVDTVWANIAARQTVTGEIRFA